MKVSVIQYRFPDGRPVEQFTDIADDCKPFYERMCKRGWNLAVECQADEVTLYIEDRKREKDIAIEVVPNGPQVQLALETMLRSMK